MTLHGDRDGYTYDPKQDGARLNKQAADVYSVMSQPGRVWHTLAEIGDATGHPEASVSARLRDLRKPKFGGHTILRRRRSKGLWEYKIGNPGEAPPEIKKPRREYEYHLQCAVAQLLETRRAPGVFYTAIPMGEARSKRAGARVKAMGGRAGSPDMLIVRFGMAIGLEFKSPNGRQSPAQEAIAAEWRAAGGDYVVLRRYREAHDYLALHGRIKREPEAIISMTEAHLEPYANVGR